jgi:hypothetical protein
MNFSTEVYTHIKIILKIAVTDKREIKSAANVKMLKITHLDDNLLLTKLQ